ncbi:hypothetical protein [Burkholderia gladioli]|uniref:hypothetical protein n=1 Tax=Burkholderia gladioli TaxID=28095 RepID=UPI00163FBC4E|nr:hypothetical protein [Burkholderia gladioli]MBJ9674504.1 hypothetical protein [Burkholderia gladioli]MDN7462628.1 hypothetical protein [Burkholderia gladioli]
MLEQHDESVYSEIGAPPWTATTIASQVGGSIQSVARTLRAMALAGDIVAVRDRQSVYNAISRGSIETPVTAYYSASTMERDLALAKAWKAGSSERSTAAFEIMTARFIAGRGPSSE